MKANLSPDMSALINKIVNDTVSAGVNGGKTSGAGIRKGKKSFIDNFDVHPAELIARLEERVIGQKTAIRTLSTVICGHYNSIRYRLEKGEDPMRDVDRIKDNIMLIGSTGVGKTHLVKLIAQELGVPFYKTEATKYPETGYVGGDVEDMVRELAESTRDANGEVDLKMAQFGIIFVDEIDKVASSGRTSGPDVSRQGVQRALLPIIEETDVVFKTKNDISEQLRIVKLASEGRVAERQVINTRNILFIFAGVFPQLDEVIAKQNKTGIGFEAAVKPTTEIARSEKIKKVTDGDLTESGFESEFIGRIPIRVVLDDLSDDDLFQILNHPKSAIVKHFKDLMASYGIDVSIDEAVLRYIADKAAKSSTGARSLLSAFYAVTEPYKCHLPDIPLSKFALTTELVDGSIEPAVFLKELSVKAKAKMKELANKQVIEECFQVSHRGYADYVFQIYGLNISFNVEAIQFIRSSALYHSMSEFDFCNKNFSAFEPAFGYLKKADVDSLILTMEAFKNPHSFLELAFKKK